MEVIKNSNTTIIKNFLSGSEANLLAYEFKWRDVDKNPGSLMISENYSDSAPIAILVKSIKKKLNKVLSGYDINGLDCIYDIKDSNIKNLFYTGNGLGCIISLDQSIHVQDSGLEKFPINPGEAFIFQGSLTFESDPDPESDLDAVHSFIFATLN